MKRAEAVAKLESIINRGSASQVPESDIGAVAPFLPELISLPNFELVDLPTIAQIFNHRLCERPADSDIVTLAAKLIKRAGLRAAFLLRYVDLERQCTVEQLWKELDGVPDLRTSVWTTLNIRLNGEHAAA